MLSGTDRGFEIREYFLEVERRFQAQAPSVAALLADPTALRALLAGLTDQVSEAQATIAELAPKADFHDAVADSTNSQTMQATAKALGMGPNTLFAELRRRRILLPSNLPYQAHIDAGRFRVIEGHYKERDGIRQAYTRTLVTGKGFVWLQKLLREAGTSKQAEVRS